MKKQKNIISQLFSKVKTVILLTFLIVCSDIANAQTSEVPWMEGSWGVRLIIRGGKDLDRFVGKGYDYVEAAKQIVRDYPTMGHVITNFTNNANSSLFLLRENPYVDIANDIHPDFVPSLKNEQVILDVLKVFKDAGVKVILYINHKPSMADGTAAQVNAWNNYVAKQNTKNFPAFELICKGFAKRFDGLIDGYWIDNFGGAATTIPAKDSFVNALLDAHTIKKPVIATNWKKSYFSGITVDSDGPDERDPDNYKVIKYQANDMWSDFTHGHVTSIGGQKAPSNSWGYDEFTLPDFEDSGVSVSSDSGKTLVKHMFAPIRRRWSLNSPIEKYPLMYDKDQAYRFVKRITDAGGAITFSTTITDGGLPMPDENAVLKHVNAQLEANADYVPYERPSGAYLVGETKPNYNQVIDFHNMNNKQVGNPDFFPFVYASSGAAVKLTSSNTNVATIVNNKIRIKGKGTTNITALQGGNNTFSAAESVTRQLTVGEGDNQEEEEEIDGDNLALNGTATQSTTLNGAEASRAIDGDINGNFKGNSVSAAQGPDAWWQVDLGGDQKIDEIKVFNRTNNCCSDRLANFTIYVIDNNGTTTYSKTITSAPSPSITIDANGAVGQVVRIESNLTKTLNLAEVEVYGSSSTECPEFTTIEAEDFDNMSGVQVEGSSDTGAGEQIGYINNGDWTMYSNIDLTCATSIKARVSSKTSGGNIEVRLGGVSGELIGTIPVTTTNSWTTYKTVSSAISSVNGTHNVYLVYTGGNGYLFNVNSVEFSSAQAKTVTEVTSNKGQLLIYPNPVVDQFTISLGTTETTSYTISDTSGKTVLTGVINEGTSSINVSGFTSGLYLIKIANEEQTLTGKIIKQ